MKRIIGLVLVAALAVASLTACMGDDDDGTAQQQRRTAALGVSGGAGQEYQLTFEPSTVGMQAIHPLGLGQAVNVAAFSWDAESPTTIGSATGGAGVGKVKFNQFNIQKTVDTASPKLFRNMAAGAHYKRAILSVRKAGAKEPYYEIRFDTVFTTKIENAGSNPEVPMESITFVYGAMQTVAREIGAEGVKAPVVHGWNQVTNVAYDQQ
jgi:type VI secretion system secreted protein Hcp